MTQFKGLNIISTVYDRVRAAGPFVFFNYFQAGLSLVISILLANAIGATEFGVYNYGLVFATGLPLIVGFAEDRTLVRDLVHDENPSAVMSASILTRLSLSAMSLGGIALWLSWHPQTSRWTILICAICGLLAGLTPRAWFDYRSEMTKHAIITFCERFLFSILLLAVLFGASGLKNAVTVSIFLLVSAALSVTFQWFHVCKSFKFVLYDFRRYFSFLLKENFLIWIAILGNFMMTHVNRIILTEKSGPSEMAFYGLALQFVMVIQLLQIQVLRLMTPHIAHLTRGAYNSRVVRGKLLRYVGISFGLTSLVIVPIFFFVPFVVKHFMKSEYLGVMPSFYILLIWIMFYGAAIINNQFLICLRLNKSFIATTLFFGLLSLGLAFIWVPLFGSVGAALSLLVSHSGSVITQFILVYLKLRESSKNGYGGNNGGRDDLAESY